LAGGELKLANPRGVSATADGMWLRVAKYGDACHANAMENYIFFATGVLAATFTK
jgi:uncharacterized MAPEG superfamily protein